jgi:polysaccharide export outer membrane protein
MRALAVTALVAGALVLAGAKTPVWSQNAGTRLRPGDGVRIEIKNEQQLSGEFIVGTDGSLLLPTIGTIQAAERPFAEVEDELRKKYSSELVEPVVRITPLVRIAVLGEVRAPGLFLIDATYSVADVLARAGGLMPNANAKKIVISRPTGAVVARFALDSPPLEAHLDSGYQIMVSRRGWASEHMGILLSAAGSVAVALITSSLLR